ncbi:MAG: dihydroorotate dehydrogenase [Candidatus Omnitrophota bacterium]|nr:dihydroorotate dehydrogenase [Candidatus Omnitrophota bacterium]
MNLEVKIGRLRLKNPVIVASGTFGPGYGGLVDINSLGALVLKTITLDERCGNPPPRIAETASGMLNSIGLENKGVEDFIKNKIAKLKGIKAPLIASIAGNDKKEYAALAKRLGKVGAIAALEINLSCPNVKHGAHEGLIAQDADATYAVVRAVRGAVKIPLIAKLAPNVADISGIAIAAQNAGADAVLIANTVAAMAVDIETGRPKLGNITGGLSGPAIKPIALKLVWDAYNKIDIPIIGCGGIMDTEDALEFILCGAQAVQVGTAIFVDPKTPVEIVKGINKYCLKNKIKDIGRLVGSLKIGAL